MKKVLFSMAAIAAIATVAVGCKPSSGAASGGNGNGLGVGGSRIDNTNDLDELKKLKEAELTLMLNRQLMSQLVDTTVLKGTKDGDAVVVGYNGTEGVLTEGLIGRDNTEVKYAGAYDIKEKKLKEESLPKDKTFILKNAMDAYIKLADAAIKNVSKAKTKGIFDLAVERAEKAIKGIEIPATAKIKGVTDGINPVVILKKFTKPEFAAGATVASNDVKANPTKIATISNWAAIKTEITTAKGAGTSVEKSDYTITVTAKDQTGATQRTVSDISIDDSNGEVKAKIADAAQDDTYEIKLIINAVDDKMDASDEVTCNGSCS